MIYLLIATLLSIGLTIWAGTSVGKGDDFGAAFSALIFGGLSAILTIVYFALVFWNHRFV